MAGVGKLLKQAQKMQKRIEEAQADLANTSVEVAHGGGAVKIVLELIWVKAIHPSVLSDCADAEVEVAARCAAGGLRKADSRFERKSFASAMLFSLTCP